MTWFKNPLFPISFCALTGLSFGFAKIFILIFSILFLKDAAYTFKKYFKATEPIFGMLYDTTYRFFLGFLRNIDEHTFKTGTLQNVPTETSPLIGIRNKLRKIGFGDNLTDVYMNILIKSYSKENDSLKLIPTKIMTDVVNGDFSSRFYENMESYKMVFGIIRMKNHSALIVISIKEKYLVYFDPCIHEMEKCSKKYIKKFLHFLENNRELKKINWKIYKLENGLEKFSSEIECDVAVMAFAECLLTDSGPLMISPNFLKEEKNKILNAVLAEVAKFDANESTNT